MQELPAKKTQATVNDIAMPEACAQSTVFSNQQ